MRRDAAYPAALLGATALAVRLREPHVVSGLGAALLLLAAARARAHRTTGGRLAVANGLTALRLATVVALPSMATRVPMVIVAGIALGLLALDGLDGYVARARDEVSPFGARFDMETDALAVATLGLLLWQRGAGAWVLIPGLWRYAYAALVAFAPAFGDCPPSPLYRRLFAALMLCLAAALVPDASTTPLFAAAATCIVSFSFLHSLARSRGVRSLMGLPPL